MSDDDNDDDGTKYRAASLRCLLSECSSGFGERPARLSYRLRYTRCTCTAPEYM